jgi:AraC family transcriptional regulator, positive regulator of tynA and feaB
MRGTDDYESSNERLRNVCGAYRVACDRWWEFRGSIRTHRIGSLELADVTFSPCAVIRDHHDEHYRGDQYFLVLQADGSARMRQRGSEALLSPGDCTLIDSRYPSVFESARGFRQYSFHLPAPLFNERFGGRNVPMARTIHGDRGPGRVLSEVLNALVRNAPSLQGVELTDMTLHLVAAALGTTVGEVSACDAERRGISAREVTHYIDANIREPELTPQRIADHFNISIRQLYRVVAFAGCTPAALIWRQRLNHARVLLEERTSRVPIIEIALNCGFKDGAHFSRAYRKAFGHSPRTERAGWINGMSGQSKRPSDAEATVAAIP